MNLAQDFGEQQMDTDQLQTQVANRLIVEELENETSEDIAVQSDGSTDDSKVIEKQVGNLLPINQIKSSAVLTSFVGVLQTDGSFPAERLSEEKLARILSVDKENQPPSTFEELKRNNANSSFKRRRALVPLTDNISSPLSQGSPVHLEIRSPLRDITSHPERIVDPVWGIDSLFVSTPVQKSQKEQTDVTRPNIRYFR